MGYNCCLVFGSIIRHTSYLVKLDKYFSSGMNSSPVVGSRGRNMSKRAKIHARASQIVASAMCNPGHALKKCELHNMLQMVSADGYLRPNPNTIYLGSPPLAFDSEPASSLARTNGMKRSGSNV